MRRRAFLATTVAVLVSGCSSAHEELAAAIDEDMEVGDTELDEETYRIEYETSGSLSTDHERIGLRYADAVDNGVEEDLEAVATGASNQFTWQIENELAQQFNAGEISEEEYLSQVGE